jgi:hypothetical protein
MPVGLLVAGFLLAHAAIHVGFIAPPPPATADGPAWPFAMDRAWPVTRLGLDPALMRSLALGLVAVTVAGYALAALTALGLLPTFIWSAAIVIGSIASLGIVAACFHPWLLLGVVIDLALLWSSLVVGWQPAVDGSGI